MSKTQGKGNQTDNKRWKGKRSRNSKEANNFQDRAMDREFDKGARYAIQTGSNDNDPSWYVPNGQILKDVASLPTISRSGYPLKYNNLSSGSTADTTFVPGIFAYYIIPTFGPTENSADALDTASAAFYTSLRRATSVRSDYDKEDSMLYILAVGNVISFYAYCLRIYGYAATYSINNTYLPKALLRTMGMDFDDVVRNLADYRAWLNQFAYKLQALALPKALTYLTRHIFLYSNVYTDADTAKAQYYSFNPIGFFKYSEGTESSPAGMLQLAPLPCCNNTNYASTTQTVEQLMNYGDNLVQPIIGSQDCMYIASDIIKAFGPGAMYKVNPIAETFSLSPVYNKEVLMQFENAYVYNFASYNVSLTQKININDSRLSPNYNFLPGYSSATDTFKILSTEEGFAAFDRDRILVNFHHDSPTPEQFMVATRLSGSGFNQVSNVTWTDTAGTQHTWSTQPKTMGTEIVAGAVMWYYASIPATGSTSVQTMPFMSDTFYNLTSGGSFDGYNLQQLMIKQQVLSTFDWHPQARYWFTAPTSGSNTPVWSVKSGANFDIENVAIVSDENLRELNKVAVLAELTSSMEPFTK